MRRHSTEPHRPLLGIAAARLHDHPPVGPTPIAFSVRTVLSKGQILSVAFPTRLSESLEKLRKDLDRYLACDGTEPA